MTRIVEHIHEQKGPVTASSSFQPAPKRPASIDQPWRHYKPHKPRQRQTRPVAHLIVYLALYGVLMTLLYWTK